MPNLVLTVECGWNFWRHARFDSVLLEFRELDDGLGLHDLAGDLLLYTAERDSKYHGRSRCACTPWDEQTNPRAKDQVIDVAGHDGMRKWHLYHMNTRN